MQKKLEIVWLRVKALITHPAEEWKAIKSEPGSISELFTNYVVYLAAVPALSILIGYGLIGEEVPLLGYLRSGPLAVLFASVLCYFLSLGAVYLVGRTILYFAAYFEAKPDPLRAMKLAVYSATPFFLSCVFFLYPSVKIFSIVRWYGLWVCYLGLNEVMETPRDKVATYLIVIGLATLIIIQLINTIVWRFLGQPLLIGG